MRIAVDRPTIEMHVREATSRLLGLPVDKVFINDFASDTAAPVRPYVSLQIAPSASDTRQGTVQYESGLEMWYFEIQSSADGPYTITIDSDIYTHNAVSQTATQIRDALVALISSPDYTAVAAATVTIEVSSEVLRKRLLPVAGAGIALIRVRGNVVKVTTRTVELILQARCVGYYSDTPTATNSGVDMAERLLVSLLDPDETYAMRQDGIAINRGVVTDITAITDGFTESIGALDAIITTNYAFISTVSDVTETSFEWGTP